ncbi:hypothetical protein DFH11DRAFT_513760 [Phellopilus nigrolimitatus]|nr:hypothetical protein DFH11DRAFT_513760 [Phellopilus nigrolimitatus]
MTSARTFSRVRTAVWAAGAARPGARELSMFGSALRLFLPLRSSWQHNAWEVNVLAMPLLMETVYLDTENEKTRWCAASRQPVRQKLRHRGRLRAVVHRVDGLSESSVSTALAAQDALPYQLSSYRIHKNASRRRPEWRHARSRSSAPFALFPHLLFVHFASHASRSLRQQKPRSLRPLFFW